MMRLLILAFYFFVNSIIFAGYSFLKLPHDAKSSALGNNAVSISSSFSVYSNPSLILYSSDYKNEIAFSSNKFYEDLSGYNIVYNFLHKQFKFSVAFENYSIKNIPYYPDYPTERPITYFSSHFLNFSIGSAFNLSRYVFLGLSGNFIYQKLYENSTSYGYFINLGFGISPFRGLILAGSFNNMGISTKIEDKRLTAPSYYSFGISYEKEFLNNFSSFLSLNYKKFEKENFFTIGTGIKLYNIIHLLISNTVSHDSYFFNKLSYGFELYYRKFAFAYSLQNTGEFLDNTKLITISRVF